MKHSYPLVNVSYIITYFLILFTLILLTTFMWAFASFKFVIQTKALFKSIRYFNLKKKKKDYYLLIHECLQCQSYQNISVTLLKSILKDKSRLI